LIVEKFWKLEAEMVIILALDIYSTMHFLILKNLWQYTSKDVYKTSKRRNNGAELFIAPPEAGIGPATYWLTASRSTIELLGHMLMFMKASFLEFCNYV